ncbi:iron transport multicopper oxidase FET5 [Aspergillus udagawae]|nr:iron transport multicopper oxidase FET5 [Aspergillus udagawae]
MAGLFPGPTIEARSGDTLVITLINRLEDESISIHWHGLQVQSSMDGAAGVSQCPIAPGSKFIYNLTVPENQSGTFWYHAHSGVARADGLYGGFVVHAPSVNLTVRDLMAEEKVNHRGVYGTDLLLLIGDWYHQPASQVLDWYMRAGSFGNEPVPDSLLINGVGHFNCSMAVPARPVDCVDHYIDLSYLDFDDGLPYRIRVVNTGSLAGFTLSFADSVFDLIQLDSNDVEPQSQASSAGVLYPGQRMDAILMPLSGRTTHDQKSMTIKLDEENLRYLNPALSSKQTFSISTDKTTRPQADSSNSKLYPKLNLETVPSSRAVLSSLPKHANQTHVVYTKIQKLSKNHNVPYAFFNRTSWRPQSNPSTPLLYLPRDKWDENQLSIATGLDLVWVDLVVNNLDEGSHPFHLHGHHFYVLQVYKAPIGWGSYNPFTDAHPPGLEPVDSANATNNGVRDASPYDLSRAVLRDTVQIPSRGYAVLRFRAENPGVWLFHCHIVWHLANGMAMVVDVMRDETVDGVFSSGQECTGFLKYA